MAVGSAMMSPVIALDRHGKLAADGGAEVRIMLIPTRERCRQPLDRVGVELGISRPAVPARIGSADVRNSRETLSACRRLPAGEGADVGRGIEDALLCRAVCQCRIADRRSEQRPDGPGLQVARPLLEVLMVAARLTTGGFPLVMERRQRTRSSSFERSYPELEARLLKASCSRLCIASCVVKFLISSASFGGAPSRNARTLSTKKASPSGKVVDNAL